MSRAPVLNVHGRGSYTLVRDFNPHVLARDSMDGQHHITSPPSSSRESMGRHASITRPHAPVPATSSHDPVPDSSSHDPVPATSSHDPVPATSSHAPVPATSSHATQSSIGDVPPLQRRSTFTVDASEVGVWYLAKLFLFDGRASACPPARRRSALRRCTCDACLHKMEMLCRAGLKWRNCGAPVDQERGRGA